MSSVDIKYYLNPGIACIRKFFRDTELRMRNGSKIFYCFKLATCVLKSGTNVGG